MEIKKNRNYFKIVLIIFFIMFIVLYFTAMTDLYQYNQYNRMTITKEAMKKFEKDIESGKDITISDYLNTVQDYSNNISNLGYKTSNFVNKIMNESIRKTFKVLASFFV